MEAVWKKKEGKRSGDAVLTEGLSPMTCIFRIEEKQVKGGAIQIVEKQNEYSL